MPEFTPPANPFLLREVFAANEIVKQPIRSRIAEFFAKHQSYRVRPRCFCLPGVRWAFEHELSNHLRRPAEFIGVERDRRILEGGLGYMPGKYPIEHEELTRAHHFKGYRTDRSTVFNCAASTFIDLGRTWKCNRQQVLTWARLYKGWTCAWLDFQSDINEEVIRCCKSLENNLHEWEDEIPVAITFMIGREDRDTFSLMNMLDPDGTVLSKRVTLLRAVWESHRFKKVDVVDSWQYKSAGGCPMGVMTAIFRTNHRNTGNR